MWGHLRSDSYRTCSETRGSLISAGGGLDVEYGVTGLDELGARATCSGDRLRFASSDPSPEQFYEEALHAVQVRQSGPGTERPLSRPGDASEREAKAAAGKLARGEPAPAVREKPKGAIQRDEDGSSAGGDLDWDAFFGAQSVGEPLSTSYPEVDGSCVSASGFGNVPYEDSIAGGSQTNFTITDCGDEVLIDLPFRVDPSQAGVVGRYEEGILDVLDNQYQLTDPDGSIHGVRMNPSFQVGHLQGDSAYFNDIYDAKDNPRGAGVVDMNYFPIQEVDRPDGAGAAWERTSPDSIENSAAHEAAHRLLMPDRYWRSAAEFELIVGRPPQPWEVDKEASANAPATYRQHDNLMGDNVPILPENGLDGLLPFIGELRGVPSISSLQYPPDDPVCEPSWPQ